MTQMNNRRTGFTLIELLVTISIIAILASIVVVGIGTLRRKADTQKVRTFCDSASMECFNFRQKYKRYPYGAPEEEDTLNSKMASGGWYELCPTGVTNSRTGDTLTGTIDINKQMMMFLTIYPDFVGPGGAVIDIWGKAIQSQFNWHNKKTVFWSAGYDKTFDFSTSEDMPSPFISTKSMKESNSVPDLNTEAAIDALKNDIVSTF